MQQRREAVAAAVQRVGQRAVHRATPVRGGGGVHRSTDERAAETEPVTGQDELPGQRFRTRIGSETRIGTETGTVTRCRPQAP